MIKQIFKWLGIILVILLLYFFIRYQYIKDSIPDRLPSDKRMLKHFKQHRAEFEKLVQYHRQYDYLEQVNPRLPKLNKEEQEALLKQAGVKRVYGTFWGWMGTSNKMAERYRSARESGGYFNDRPIKTVDNVHSTFYKHPHDVSTQSPDEIKKLKKTFPNQSFHNMDIFTLEMTPIADLTRIVEIELAEPRYSIFFYKRKVYMHFPRPPIIQNNRIMIHTPIDGYLVPAHRIVDSLDDPPSDWNNECLLKAIDMQWFISLYECGKPIPFDLTDF